MSEDQVHSSRASFPQELLVCSTASIVLGFLISFTIIIAFHIKFSNLTSIYRKNYTSTGARCPQRIKGKRGEEEQRQKNARLRERRSTHCTSCVSCVLYLADSRNTALFAETVPRDTVPDQSTNTSLTGCCCCCCFVVCG